MTPDQVYRDSFVFPISLQRHDVISLLFKQNVCDILQLIKERDSQSVNVNGILTNFRHPTFPLTTQHKHTHFHKGKLQLWIFLQSTLRLWTAVVY